MASNSLSCLCKDIKIVTYALWMESQTFGKKIAPFSDINHFASIYLTNYSVCFTPQFVKKALNSNFKGTLLISFLSPRQRPGCELNYQDSDGWTALWHAYSSANYDICSILLRAGADKHIRNHDGRTVVEDAKETEEEVMLELFQKYNNLV